MVLTFAPQLAKYPRVLHTLGVDLGQQHDPTALSVIERYTVNDGTPDRPQERHAFAVRYLERLPLGTTYPKQVEHVQAVLGRLERDHHQQPRTDAPTLVIDQTGVGRPVLDMFRAAGMRPEGVTITAGEGESRHGNDWRVAKLTLVSRLQAMLHAGELKIARDLPETQALVKELQDFRATFTNAGNAVFNAREGAHDDLVLSVAIALWWTARPQPVSARRKTKGF